MKCKIAELPNGLRLIHKQIDSPVAHCGIMINTGSRDETSSEHGITHLIEHLIFKGTSKRKAYHILSRMEDVGGELNAYTSKEETCIHTSFFNNYYDRAFELLRDILFYSTFPAKEIEKEKEVILDEINSYKDSPFELIFDDFEEQIFHDHPMANNILGSEKSLKKIDRQAILDFYNLNYPTTQMIVASVGNMKFEKVAYYFEKYFSDIPRREVIKERKVFDLNNYRKSTKTLSKDTHQAHCIIGAPAYSYNDDRRLALHLLANYLGGPGLNSKLNMSLREKRGYAYNVEANYTLYSDTGIVSIYFGSDEKDLNKSIRLTLKELENLKTKKLGPTQLLRAKKQLTGQIAMAAENHENQMLSIAKSLLVYNKVDDLETITRRIQQITAEEIIDVANDIFDPNRLSTLIFK
ncbi:MAG TPA: peptidase M16 [Bacteroidales bacterium]|jgi:predicted Zn-dependent peptidase|nr:peptidase M16 [Bacteroidales bacterium]